MVERWPHSFTLQKYDSITDEKGNVSDSDLIEKKIKGRAKVSGGTGMDTIITENGDVAQFTHSISFPWFKDVSFDYGTLLWKGKSFTIVKFREYQNRCKVWI